MPGLTKDLIEYGNGLTLKDALNAKIYEDIANNGEKNTVILFSAGNQDAKKALDVLALENRSLENNIDFISMGSPVDEKTLSQAASKVQSKVSGQYIRGKILWPIRCLGWLVQGA